LFPPNKGQTDQRESMINGKNPPNPYPNPELKHP
jgi:hypothetical protein